MRRAIVFSCLCLVLTGCPAKELDLGEGQDGGTGSGDCTVGEDQTCNSDPTVSALWGTCQPDGTCLCSDGFSVDPTSGKCVSDATDGGATPACIFGQDQTCNPDPTISALYGTCQADGTCLCNDGFAVDPITGKCMVDAIDGGCLSQGDLCQTHAVSSPDPCCDDGVGSSERVDCLGAGVCTLCGTTGAACDGARPCCQELRCNDSHGCQPY
jgi:hypothetical protein